MIGRVRRQAFAAAQEAYSAASEGRDLIEDFQDGFGITVEFDDRAVVKLGKILLGQAGDLPLKVKIDPTVDT